MIIDILFVRLLFLSLSLPLSPLFSISLTSSLPHKAFARILECVGMEECNTISQHVYDYLRVNCVAVWTQNTRIFVEDVLCKKEKFSCPQGKGC